MIIKVGLVNYFLTINIIMQAKCYYLNTLNNLNDNYQINSENLKTSKSNNKIEINSLVKEYHKTSKEA